MVDNIDLSPLLISLKTGIITIIITFILGILLARWVMNLKHHTIKVFIECLMMLPLVLPPTVVGFILLYFCGTNGIIGKAVFHIFHYRIAFSFIATVIAAVVISLPLMYRSAKAAFEDVDTNYILSARALGMNDRQIFIKIILPLSRNGLISGSILSFARGLGEFGATSMLAGNIANVTRTLPIAIYSEVAASNFKQASFYVLLILFISVIAVVFVYYYETKRKKEIE